MNILILSCGSRNKIVQYFKKELGGLGLVLAADCSELAPALYDADMHFIVPRIDSEDYVDCILNICKSHNVKAVLSLIDPELSLLSVNKQKFIDAGTTPIISDVRAIELSFDKYEMYKFLSENGIKTVKTYVDRTEFYEDIKNGSINYPVFVKPRTGSASININIVNSQEELEVLFTRDDNLIIQELMNGTEYGADVYIDMISDEPVAIFTKRKIKMRAGETDKSVSFKDEKLFELIKKLVILVGLKGAIDIDIFQDQDEYIVSEINPRFGGGYPHAYECGVNIPGMILENLKGNINPDTIGEYDSNVYMMKYNELKILRL